MSTEYHFRNDMSETTSLEKQSSFCGNSDLEIFEQTQIQFHSINSGWNWILHRNKIEILQTTYSWNISGKNARAWLSMVLCLKRMKSKILKQKKNPGSRLEVAC